MKMVQKQKKTGLFALVLLSLLAFGMVACKDSSSDVSAQEKVSAVAAKPAEKAGAAEKVDEHAGHNHGPIGEQKDESGGEGPPTNIYPGFNLAVLNASQRTMLVELASEELCPCPGATNSLHECLQKEDRCGMAAQVAGTMGMAIQEGLNKRDVLDRVAKFVEASNKAYDFALEGVPHKGNKDAKVVLIEFADFKCPHCRMAAAVLDEVQKKYGDEKVAVYFKQFPLGSPDGQLAAQASLAANNQGKFWPMHDLIFKNQHALSADKINSFAQQIGLNFTRFQADMKSPEIIAMVNRDRKEGEAANVRGTPAIFINGRNFVDDKSVEGISKAVDAILKEDSAK